MGAQKYGERGCDVRQDINLARLSVCLSVRLSVCLSVSRYEQHGGGWMRGPVCVVAATMLLPCLHWLTIMNGHGVH